MVKLWTVLGAVNGFLAVALGAFAAHGLRSRPGMTDRLLANFETGARYHMYHALALFAVAWLGSQRGSAADVAGYAFLAGIALFSGSLYAMALTGATKLGAVTPVGGLGFLLGWAVLAWVAAKG